MKLVNNFMHIFKIKEIKNKKQIIKNKEFNTIFNRSSYQWL